MLVQLAEEGRVVRFHRPPVDDHLAAFCEAQHRQLVGLLVLSTGDPLLAEELAQDALARLCSHWGKVQDMDHPSAWLRRVALNLAASKFRRRQAERRAHHRHGPPPAQNDPDTASAVAVRDAVRRLPPRQRTAIILRYFVRLSVAETANEMGCAPGTVKSLTNRAVTQLRSQLFEPEELRS